VGVLLRSILATMQSKEIRKRFIEFFKKRGHAEIPSASLVPENDPSVLFTTAGMQPLVPYLLGQPHPMGNKLVNVQKCVRTQDIDEVGDNTHDTFFEMLGNWSLGAYFKEDAIKWSYELLTSKEEGFGLDPRRLYVTVFEGDENVPRDEESVNIWKSVGITEDRIYYLGASDNWWPARKGEWRWSGPTGPDTEMFYDITEEGLGNLSHQEFIKATDEQQIVEIWNDVFMEYQALDGQIVGKLNQKNVDTGAGLERLAMVLQKKNNIFDTDLFEPIMAKINNLATLPPSEMSTSDVDIKSKRIVADHVRTAVFMINDGVLPSNTDRGYILRRLIRRAIWHSSKMGAGGGEILSLVDPIVEKYQLQYPNILENVGMIKSEINKEIDKFGKTLDRGIKEFESGERDAFLLFTSYGFPFELTRELARERGETIDESEFQKKMKEHQDLSRAGAAQKFAGGLADHKEETVRLHTAHHLLLAALQKVLGSDVKQRGSNITSERLRIDFSFGRKMTPEEVKQVENLVNKKIEEKLPVVRKEMSKGEAEKLGAQMEFGVKYGDMVSVYFVGEPVLRQGYAGQSKMEEPFSIEFCGGPHVSNTGDLAQLGGKAAKFKIMKEEASSAGVRRIKAVLG